MIENGAYLLVGLIVLCFLLGYGILPFDGSALLLTVVIVTNTVNLFALMFVLGYGLVAYPQMLWTSASVDASLLQAQHNAAAQFKSFSDVSAEVSQVVFRVQIIPKIHCIHKDFLIRSSSVSFRSW